MFNLLFTNLPFSFLQHEGAQKEGGGPNVFMREALNLVDFFVSNYLTQDVDLSTLEVSVGLLPCSCVVTFTTTTHGIVLV